MKLNLVLLLSLLLSFPLVSFANTKNSKTVSIASPTIVANKELKPGRYKVEWNGTAPNVQVVFFRNHKEIVTAPAKLIRETAGHSAAQNGPALVQHKGPDSSNVLDEIDFTNIALNFHKIPTGA